MKNIILIVVLVLVGGAIFLISRPKDPSAPSPIVETNETSESLGDGDIDFILNDFNGEEVRLSDFKGKPVFIDFWAAWCPFCLEEMPEIEAIHQEFGDQIVILGIHRTDTEPKDRGAKFAAERGVTYTLLQDTTDEVYRAYLSGRNFMPFSAWIDKEGNVVSTKAGPKTTNEMRERVAELLQ